ncbi:hypothetical protein GCM10023196_036770 [Actinoallomurus vinaceus]|uniref:Uncharacterized protein n=1 Tax=Actinoallomurus vinaceus TaxID=1080074 RepID=A0ABP8UCW3_9ACTN
MKPKLAVFGYPSLIVAFVAAGLNLLVGFGLPFTRVEVGLVNAAVAAVAAAVTAYKTRPYPVPLLVGAGNALIAVAVGVGAHISPAITSIIDGGIVLAAAFFTHQAVSPVVISQPTAPASITSAG